MIKRLRIKLIIASMASLFAVLVTIMAVMAAVNYDKITDVADSTFIHIDGKRRHVPSNGAGIR